MKKIITATIAFCMVLFLVSCTNGGTKNSQVTIPVYQGMQVSKDEKTNTTFNYRNEKNLFNNNETEFDFDIEDNIINHLDVVTSQEVDYYMSRNEDFFITVKLLNPDNLIILSFTLNGTFYQSYQFQDGSDSENLILKVNSGDISGIKDYTIDSI